MRVCVKVMGIYAGYFFQAINGWKIARTHFTLYVHRWYERTSGRSNRQVRGG